MIYNKSTISDTLALANSVNEALEFYNEHPDETLIIVTGDHETGGLTIGYAGTDYDTYLTNLKNQKLSYAKFDSDYVSKYKENNTSFSAVLKDVKKLFGLMTADDKDAASNPNLVLTDYEFVPGDVAYVRISHRDGEILSVSMTDHYRLPWELLLVGIFVAALILFAGQTGIRAVLSFILTILMIWKIVVPLYLNGVSPVISGIAITALLSIMIVSLVYGFDRRAAASSLGIIIGLGFTAALGAIFTRLMNIHGAVMIGSESLLYCGFQDLNLTEIFMAAIFIGSSGAMMDLAVDITSAVDEVIRKKPDITPWEAVKSGITVGRAAMGTITTTLLLAYSGSCIAQLMVFMAQGTPLDCILNYKYIAAELIHTVAGSFGIVAVAPVTALAAGLLLARGEEHKQ